MKEEINKISIIVPIYKVEPYLRQCVDSIINQTYKNIEIILIDDGSPDKCPVICDKYAIMDKRIRVIHKVNGGLSDARNAGLEIATGDYLGFVDGDDWISLTMYEELIHAALEYDADISCCGYNHMDNTVVLESKLFSEKKQGSRIDLLRDIFCKNIDNVVVWNKIYKKKLFKGVKFPFGEIHEDNLILCSTIGKVNKVAYTGTIGYYYRFRVDSIMNALSVEPHIVLITKFLPEIKAFIEKNHPELYDDYRCYEVNNIIYLLQFFDSDEEKTTQTFKTLKNRLHSNLCSYLINKNVRIKNKMEAILMFAGFYKPVQKIYRKIIKCLRL
jgi:Glycosyltransferases involved in cell wall biogenesis